jgi:hypothetical protein
VRKSYITVSLVELLRNCYPASVSHVKGKYYPRDTMVSDFLNATISIIRELDSLDYKITAIKKGKGENIILHLTHPDRLKTVRG